MIKIRAAELAPENIGYPIKMVLDGEIYYHMLTGFKNNDDSVIIYCGQLIIKADLDYYITVYDKDI